MKNKKNCVYKLLVLLLINLVCLLGCSEESWNDPYPFDSKDANTLYLDFSLSPKHLDPARAYSEPEWRYLAQIYEPPLQYHYLKRPYLLEGLTTSFPEIKYLNENLEELSTSSEPDNIVYSEYWITVKPGILYAPHPAFAKNSEGQYLYHHLDEKDSQSYKKLSDFKQTGTRELIAEDYVYQIKRLAEPRLSSPIFGVMSEYIIGLTELRKNLQSINSDYELDLRNFEIEGAKVIDRYTYRIRIKGKYPQFKFWLGMLFFSPIPWEATRFYAQPGLANHNISLDWYPVGTGPYQMIENNPNRRITLVKNAHYRVEFYPSDGSAIDEKLGLLDPKGSQIPSIDKIIYTLDKENIPRWHKFLQGYYDVSGISSDNFTSAIQFDKEGQPLVSQALAEKKIRLQTTVSPDLWSWGFNMLDEVVGGNSLKAKKLRQAINEALDVDYFINIFMNGRGIRAFGPIPPDIFGFEAQPKPSALNHHSKQAKIEKAKKLLKEAGIKNGFTLYMDAYTTGDPGESAIQSWLVQQFQRIGINLIIRSTDFNRFQAKLKQGTSQFFFWGWSADYPDPENFLFLFYSQNGRAQYEGENVTNYNNGEYDKLFEKMKITEDGPKRLQIIKKMVNILNADVPVVFGFYPKTYSLYHDWVRIGKPSRIVDNTIKYSAVNGQLRQKLQQLWNRPKLWPFFVIFIFLGLILLAIWLHYLAIEKRVRGRI